MIRRRALSLAGIACSMTGWAAATPERTIRICGVELPPLIMATPYGSTGVVTDIVLQACQRAELRATVEVVPWARGFAALKSGDCDALIPTIRSSEREALFDFPSEPIYRSEMALFGSIGKMPAGFSGKLSELLSYRFVRLKGALFAPEFDRAVQEGRLHCEEALSFAAALRMVDVGRVDFAAVPKLAGLQIIAAEGLTAHLQVLEPALFVQPFYIALARRPDLAGVRQRLDEQLRRMASDGSSQAIEDDYRRRKWMPANPRKP